MARRGRARGHAGSGCAALGGRRSVRNEVGEAGVLRRWGLEEGLGRLRDGGGGRVWGYARRDWSVVLEGLVLLLAWRLGMTWWWWCSR